MFTLKATHIGVLVKDIQKAMGFYEKTFQVGPWEDFGELQENAEYYGKQAKLCYRAAMASIGDIGLELIQPTAEGSIFDDDLKAHGEGVHHICVAVDDIEKTIEECKKLGFTIQEKVPMYEMEPGFFLGFCFIDSDKEGGVKLELVQEVHADEK